VSFAGSERAPFSCFCATLARRPTDHG
jgi:hypothetical protein